MKIESEKSEIAKPVSEVFAFISDFNNFEKLMPEQVKDWKSSTDECSFTISGMASLGMKIEERVQDQKLKIVSQGKSPFPFTLEVNLEPSGPDKCIAQMVCDAELNPMMAMMAEKPLKKFFNVLTEKMKEIV